MSALLQPVQWLGGRTLRSLEGVAEVFALLYGALAVLLYVRTRGFRVVLQIGVTQMLFTGVHALPLVGLASLAMGTLIITQANAYLPTVELKASVAALIIVGDVVPLMVAMVLLGRSGSAICVELAGMKLSGEIDGLRAMGLPLEHVIVLPRLVAGVVSSCVLVIYGLAIGLGGGYALSKAVGSLPFALEALVNVPSSRDYVEAVCKAALFGAAIVLVSIREGYSVHASSREIPQATTRAVVNSMAIVLVLNALISITF